MPCLTEHVSAWLSRVAVLWISAAGDDQASGACARPPDQSEDDIAVALAGTAHGPQTSDAGLGPARSAFRRARWLRCQLLNSGWGKAPHYLVSEGVAHEISFETVKTMLCHACVVKGGVHRLSDSTAEYAEWLLCIALAIDELSFEAWVAH
jgi:hypothetical protein